MAKKLLPRGLRNNNPLNIRIGNVWLGEVSENTDGHFEQFVSMEYGLRAGFVLLRRYIRHYKLKTIRDIISRWSPPAENATNSYIATITRLTGIDPDKPLAFENKNAMCALVAAMVQVENGQSISDNLIAIGYDLA